eukprot:7988361-Pyramimonas_sp.AAC.1
MARRSLDGGGQVGVFEPLGERSAAVQDHCAVLRNGVDVVRGACRRPLMRAWAKRKACRRHRHIWAILPWAGALKSGAQPRPPRGNQWGCDSGSCISLKGGK